LKEFLETGIYSNKKISRVDLIWMFMRRFTGINDKMSKILLRVFKSISKGGRDSYFFEYPILV